MQLTGFFAVHHSLFHLFELAEDASGLALPPGVVQLGAAAGFLLPDKALLGLLALEVGLSELKE